MNSKSTQLERPAWPVAVVVAYLAMVVMNFLANALPLFGRDTGEISDRYPSLFTPAGFTFSVWGVIYLALAGFAYFQATNAGRSDARLPRVRRLFVLSCALNIGWLVAWHGLQIPISQVLMIALLVTLIVTYRTSGAWAAPESRAFRWAVHVPFSLYLGWISVATIANTSIFLLDLGFDGGQAAVALTVLVILVAAVLGLLGAIRRKDAAYALVIGWGLTGVAAARAGESIVLLVTAAACAVLLVAVAGWAIAARVSGTAASRH